MERARRRSSRFPSSRNRHPLLKPCRLPLLDESSSQQIYDRDLYTRVHQFRLYSSPSSNSLASFFHWSSQLDRCLLPYFILPLPRSPVHSSQPISLEQAPQLNRNNLCSTSFLRRSHLFLIRLERNQRISSSLEHSIRKRYRTLSIRSNSRSSFNYDSFSSLLFSQSRHE